MKAVAYCRVSTNEDDQLNSLQNQIDHYMNKFQVTKNETINNGIYYKRDGTYVMLNTGIFCR